MSEDVTASVQQQGALTPHGVRVAAARLVAADETIAAYCAENFGRGLLVIVDRYGVDGLPGEKDAPYCWLYTDGDNELGNVDADTFEFVVEVGAVDDAIRPSYTEEAARTAAANGLVLGGIAEKVERLRELATVKVLGFYSGETARYFFRETVLLTAVGALIGLPLGRALHRFVMEQIKVDLIHFELRLAPVSYLWSIFFTFLFVAIVDLFMYFRLERIHMAEALKSAE